ncbi:hypothetical protein ASE61_11790 [Bosea sp. Root670]|nr:hypothetical protein ASE61_11790 [Bosea sp. Root670]
MMSTNADGRFLRKEGMRRSVEKGAVARIVVLHPGKAQRRAGEAAPSFVTQEVAFPAKMREERSAKSSGSGARDALRSAEAS